MKTFSVRRAEQLDLLEVGGGFLLARRGLAGPGRSEETEVPALGLRIQSRHRSAECQRFVGLEAEALRDHRSPQRKHRRAIDGDRRRHQMLNDGDCGPACKTASGGRVRPSSIAISERRSARRAQLSMKTFSVREATTPVELGGFAAALYERVGVGISNSIEICLDLRGGAPRMINVLAALFAGEDSIFRSPLSPARSHRCSKPLFSRTRAQRTRRRFQRATPLSISIARAPR